MYSLSCASKAILPADRSIQQYHLQGDRKLLAVDPKPWEKDMRFIGYRMNKPIFLLNQLNTLSK